MGRPNYRNTNFGNVSSMTTSLQPTIRKRDNQRSGSSNNTSTNFSSRAKDALLQGARFAVIKAIENPLGTFTSLVQFLDLFGAGIQSRILKKSGEVALYTASSVVVPAIKSVYENKVTALSTCAAAGAAVTLYKSSVSSDSQPICATASRDCSSRSSPGLRRN